VHPGVGVEQVVAATGWPLRVSAALVTSTPPDVHELEALRSLRTVQEREPTG
jgi:glutaconate CoA-transferase subunit B